MVEIYFSGVVVENIVCIQFYQIWVRDWIYCYVGDYFYFQFQVNIGFDDVGIGGGKNNVWCQVCMVKCGIQFGVVGKIKGIGY